MKAGNAEFEKVLCGLETTLLDAGMRAGEPERPRWGVSVGSNVFV